MFLSSFGNSSIKCKVAHSIRQSYLYTIKNNRNIGHYISRYNPLPYCLVKKIINIRKNIYIYSFYYNKNNLVAYYNDPNKNNNFDIIPLYNYVENNYEIMLSDLPYSSTVCVVRAPSRQVYILWVEDSKITIGNISKGTLVYSLSDSKTYLFHSMPIANSFFLVVTRDDTEIVINIIDLIEEKNYMQKCPIVKIIKTILSLSKNSIDYKEIESIGISKKLHFEIDIEKDITNNIDNSIVNLVFYDRCVVNISLSFENTKTSSKRRLKDAISIVAVYQDNELTVSLQINSNIKIETPSHDYNIDFNSITVIISNNYKMDNRYNISQSHLYSVIVSTSDYTIIRETNISPNTFVLYYKNKPNIIFYDTTFSITNLSNIFSISIFDNAIYKNLYKGLWVVKKDIFSKPNEMNKYYIEYNDSGINIIDKEDIRKLLLNSVHKNNSTNWIGIDITGIVKRVSIKDRLQEMIRHYISPSDNFEFCGYEYYIDDNVEEFYSLVCLRNKSNENPKHRFYIFKCNINYLFSSHGYFKLVRMFETSVSENRMHSLYHLNTGDKFIDSKFFEEYYEYTAYYDYKYNRRSIRKSISDPYIISILHLVRRIMPTLAGT